MIRTIWSDIRVNKLRSVLTGLSMLIGVLVLVGIMAASAVVQDAFVASVEQRTGREASYVRVLEGQDPDTALEVSTAVAERLGPGTKVRLEAGTNQILLPGPHANPLGNGEALQVTWTQGDLDDFHRRPVVAGTSDLGRQYPPRIILNRAAAEQVQLGVGDRIWTTFVPQAPALMLRVTGIVEDADEQAHAWGPLSALQAAHPPAENLGDLQLRMILDPTQSTQASAAVDSLFQSRGLSELPELLERVDEVDQLQENIGTLRTVFLAVAVTSLAVSALGLLNIGLASLAERSRELVIRRALGARRIHAFTQVIGSSLVLAVIVALLATALCLTVLYLGLPHWLPPHSPVTTPAIPWSALAIGLAAATGTAALGSTFPAWKASRLPVADALRQ